MSSLIKKNTLLCFFMLGLVFAFLIPKVTDLSWLALYAILLLFLLSLLILTYPVLSTGNKHTFINDISFVISNVVNLQVTLILPILYSMYKCKLSLPMDIMYYIFAYLINFFICNTMIKIITKGIVFLFTFDPEKVKEWIKSKKKGNVYRIGE